MTESTSIDLVPKLDTQAAEALHKQFVEGTAPFHVDASNVEHLGGQCLQVLLSAYSTFGGDGFSIVSVSKDFIDCLDTLGATEFLPMAEEAQ
ncbi:MAG: hypothetical protein AAF668_00080 [Pseudomonadota bacterium]